MFEIAELGHTLDKQTYNQLVPELRTQLLIAQQQLRNSDFPVIILISGVDGGGKGDVINLLNEWMDPRYIRTNAFGEPTDEERERPTYWRFWRTLPPKGYIGIYVGSWYSDPLSKHVYGLLDEAGLHQELVNIRMLEKELTDDGALIIKCWLHLKKETQKQRIKNLEKDENTRWQVTEKDKRHLKLYDQFCVSAEKVLKATSTDYAPWLIVDGSDIRHSSLTVGQHILERITHHLALRQQAKTQTPAPSVAPLLDPAHPLTPRCILSALDLSLNLDKKRYDSDLANYQAKLARLVRAAREKKRSSILVFEGWDAAGKGGAIRRITHAIDARNYQVIQIAAPTDEERQHHYLWRFWRHIPRAGQVTIYDRSWYGRVLVERVEKFATREEWMRAYSEIVHFEEALTRHGILLLKFWLHIDPDEQLKRFKERELIPYKQHKITAEDYRNRDKWADYEHAVNDMVARTSTQNAPWYLIEANDKRYARIKILKTYCERLEALLAGNGREKTP